MPYPEELGGAGQPYEVYLQALEEIAARLGLRRGRVSACTSCPAIPWRPGGGRSSRSAGFRRCSAARSSAATASRRPTPALTPARCGPGRDGEGGFSVSGSKAWVTHGGEADFYTLFARTSDDRARGISCFLAPGEAAGLTQSRPSARWA